MNLLRFEAKRLLTRGIKLDATVVPPPPKQPALLGAANRMRTLDNPLAFTVYGVAFNGARRARGVQVDSLATATP